MLTFRFLVKTRDIDLPADSTFATQLRSQQEAEKAEQQRIKKLVLNYDNLRADAETADADGIYDPFSSPSAYKSTFRGENDDPADVLVQQLRRNGGSAQSTQPQLQRRRHGRKSDGAALRRHVLWSNAARVTSSPLP
jgi:hypothetical protein